MATAQEIVTRAYRRLQAIDLNEQPTEAEMTNGLAALSEMVNAWAVHGIQTETQTLAATVTDDSAILSNLDTTANISPGLNIAGTGIASGARIKRILSPTTLEMTADATADGTAVSCSFSLMPIDDRHQRAVVAMLAVYMAGDSGLLDAPPRVVQDAIEGEQAILAHYIQTPIAEYDRALAPLRSNSADELFSS